MVQTEPQKRHWRQNLRWTGGLLALWFLVSFVLSYFARDLNFVFFGWPFSFWVAAQGAPLLYCLIVGFYAWKMNRQDVQHGLDEDGL